MRLILASASPRRAELLAAAGFVFETHPVDVDEDLRTAESPADYVRRLAVTKATLAFNAISDHSEDLVVLGADTTVVAGTEILGKPRDDEEARAMLQRLQGRAHQVLTGVSLRTDRDQAGAVESTTVWFAPLAADEVAWYAATGEGRDKAGAYAIQGLASRFVTRIEGSYSNVVGLPVAAVYALLGNLGGRAGLR
jgi:septum formation protein